MPPKPKYGITKELLEDLHLMQGIAPKDIAASLGCNHTLVLYYIKKYNIKKLPKYERLEGKRFGRLLVTNFARIEGRSALWNCLCDCGNSTKATTANLKFGKVQSCGCLAVEIATKHGLSATRPYSIWRGIKTRCTNPNAISYHRYGGRGISYDPRWEDFSLFWSDMKDGYQDALTIERINNDLGYSKNNCVWVDYRRQNFNKSTNVLLTNEGKTQTVTEWSKELKVDKKLLYYLHSKGLSDSDIFNRVIF
jgi:hypothetical protein